MGMYDDLLPLKAQGGLLSKLKQLGPLELQRLTEQFPSLPDDYTSFLASVGFGEIGQAQYVIYSGLGEPGFVYGEPVPSRLTNILLFGDDFQGFNAGFDTDTWTVVEIDPLDRRVDVTATSFQSFIRRMIRDLS